MTKNNKSQTVTTTTEELATVAPAGALAETLDFGDFSEDVDKRTADEMVTERIRLVQAMTKGRREAGLIEGQLYGNMTRKGLDSAVIVPVFDYRTVVERTDDGKGSFIKEYAEVKADSGDFGSHVNRAIAAVGGKIKDLRKSAKVPNGEQTQMSLTYNCYVCFLDESGTQALDFGLLQADKTNIRPYLLWRQNRVKFQGAIKFPTYAFRTIVSGKDVYVNPEGMETRNFRFEPFKNNNWKESCLCRFDEASGKITGTKAELELLTALKAQKALMQSGAIKIAEYSDSDDSEEALENAAF